MNSGVKKSSFGFQGQNSAATAGNTIPADSAVAEAIADVRNDKTETNWVLAAHVDNIPDTIRLTGSGSGGVDQLVASLNENSVMYGIGESDLLPFDGVGFEYNYFPFMAQ